MGPTWFMSRPNIFPLFRPRTQQPRALLSEFFLARHLQDILHQLITFDSRGWPGTTSNICPFTPIWRIFACHSPSSVSLNIHQFVSVSWQNRCPMPHVYSISCSNHGRRGFFLVVLMAGDYRPGMGRPFQSNKFLTFVSTYLYNQRRYANLGYMFW